LKPWVGSVAFALPPAAVSPLESSPVSMVGKSPGPTPWLESAAQLAEDDKKLRAESGRNLTYPKDHVKENPRLARHFRWWVATFCARYASLLCRCEKKQQWKVDEFLHSPMSVSSRILLQRGISIA